MSNSLYDLGTLGYNVSSSLLICFSVALLAWPVSHLLPWLGAEAAATQPSFGAIFASSSSGHPKIYPSPHTGKTRVH